MYITPSKPTWSDRNHLKLWIYDPAVAIASVRGADPIVSTARRLSNAGPVMYAISSPCGDHFGWCPGTTDPRLISGRSVPDPKSKMCIPAESSGVGGNVV